KSGADEALSSRDRLSYAVQALLARKISSGFSLQLAPILVHRNAVDQDLFVNDLVALGIGGRARLTRSVSLHLEYYARLNEKEGNPNHDAIGVGIDIETGGHVFQLVFTNTLGMMERIFVAETNEDFFDGDIHFGFSIRRTGQLSKDGPQSGRDWYLGSPSFRKLSFGFGKAGLQFADAGTTFLLHFPQFHFRPFAGCDVAGYAKGSDYFAMGVNKWHLGG